MMAPPERKALVEVPKGTRSTDVFLTVVGGHELAIACPEDCSPGDVLEISLPSGLELAGDDFLARLSDAEARDSHRSPQSPMSRAQATHLESLSPSYGWRVGTGRPTLASNPYLTEQQRQQTAVQEAHVQAIAREQLRQQQQQREDEAMLNSGGLRAMQQAGRYSAPVLAFRPLAAQRKLMESMVSEPEPLRALPQGAKPRGHAVQAPHPSLALRAPSAAVAQHQNALIAKQRQASRDPRGRAFRDL